MLSPYIPTLKTKRTQLSLALLCALTQSAFAQTPPTPEPGPPPVVVVPTQPAATTAVTPASVAAAALASASAQKPFREVIKGAHEMKGFFNVYQKDEKVWIEIKPEQFNKPFYFSVNITNSIGERGMYANVMDDAHQAVFKKTGSQVQLIAKNQRFYAQPGTPQALAVAQAFSDSLLGSTIVASAPHPETKSILVDASNLLFSDIPAYAAALESSFRVPYTLDKTNTSFSKVHVSDGQSGFGVNVHFFTPKIPTPPLSTLPITSLNIPSPPSTVPDPRSFFVGFYYSFAALPTELMPARVADDRLGHFHTTRYDFTDDTQSTEKKHWINRWRLEKKDPSLELSEPKKPIVYWLDKNVPEKYRASVTAGVLEWNKAFEKAGFKNAIVVKQQKESDQFDVMDANHASISWYLGVDVSSSVGPSKVDERSGEILSAHIRVTEGFARSARRLIAEDVAFDGNREAHLSNLKTDETSCQFAQAASADLDFAMDVLEARGDIDRDSPQAEALAQAYVRDMIMHEVGHTLGLRHNFRASTIYTLKQLQDPAFTKTHGLAGSVMDYIPFNLAAKGEVQGDYVMSTIGPYDYWAIEYAYKQFSSPAEEKRSLAAIAARSTEPLLAFATDEEVHNRSLSDPAASQFDLGSDPLAFLQKRLKISRELWDRLQAKQLSAGESYDSLRRSFNRGWGAFAQAVPVALKYIGGSTNLRDHAGTARAPITPIEIKQQREALKLISGQLFQPKSFTFSPELLSRMSGDRFERGIPYDMSVSARLLSLQSMALDELMSDGVATRMISMREKVRDPKKILGLNELYDTLQSSIWNELSSGNDISAARRNLQREHLKRLANTLLRPSTNTPADVRSIQREQAGKLLAQMRKAPTKSMSSEARAHLMESQTTLAEVLKAPLTRSGV